MNLTPEGVAIFKDLVLAIAGAFTAFAAVRGINKWATELRGKAGFETARELAEATFRVRDQLRQARSPMYFAHEFPESTGLDHSVEDWVHAYRSRMKPLFETVTQFEAKALQAEALWGRGIRAKTDVLRYLANELWAAMEADIDNRRDKGAHFREDPVFGQRTRHTIYARADGSDELSKKMMAAVEAIEQELVPHLRRKPGSWPLLGRWLPGRTPPPAA